MLDKETIKKLDFKSPHTWMATWFGSGLMSPAPGTWGTLAAMPFAMIMSIFGSPLILIIAACIVYLIGIKSVQIIEEQTKSHDSGYIVIDEVVGLWIAFVAAEANAIHFVAAFLLFRFFDILKPFPIGWLDRNLEGARGVMLDDVVAGIYAAIVLGGARYVFGI